MSKARLVITTIEVEGRTPSEVIDVCAAARSASHRKKYRTVWLYSSIVRGALAAARRCRRNDASRSSSRIATGRALSGEWALC